MTTLIGLGNFAMAQKLQLLLHDIGIVASPIGDECIIEGVRFRLRGTGPTAGVVMLGTCPACGESCESNRLFSLADVGMLLNAFEPGIGHKCKTAPPQPVPEFAALVMQLDARVRELEGAELVESTRGLQIASEELRKRVQALENRLGTLAYDHSNLRSHTSEELHAFWLEDAKQDGRLNAIVEKQQELEASLARYQDTHARTHQFLDDLNSSRGNAINDIYNKLASLGIPE